MSKLSKATCNTERGRPLWFAVVECVWNLMAHVDAREGKWRGSWRMELVASTLTLPRNVVYPALLTLMRTPRLPAVYWTDAPADLNGLVRFGERRNLVYARVPSRFKRTIHRNVLQVTTGPTFNFCSAPRRKMGPTQPPVQRVSRATVKWPGRESNHSRSSIFMVTPCINDINHLLSN
jgi:hypothetical protein